MQTSRQLSQFIDGTLKYFNLDREDFLKGVFHQDVGKEEMEYFLEKEKFPGNTLAWLSLDSLQKMAETLNLNPLWLGESFESALSQQRNHLIRKHFRDYQPPQDNLEKPHPFSMEESVSAEMIRQYLGWRNDIKVHPLQTKPNAKMDGYAVVNTPIEFTHEHSLMKQYLWVPAKYFPQTDLKNYTSKYYPALELNKNGSYGRHSGLKKYPNLAYVDMYRFTISTLTDVKNLLASLRVEPNNGNHNEENASEATR